MFSRLGVTRLPDERFQLAGGGKFYVVDNISKGNTMLAQKHSHGVILYKVSTWTPMLTHIPGSPAHVVRLTSAIAHLVSENLVMISIRCLGRKSRLLVVLK